MTCPPSAVKSSCGPKAFAGKPVPVLVSSNLIRVLFSLSRIVSKPKLSLLTQSRPTQALPWTIRSSGITWSSAMLGVRPLLRTAGAAAAALRSSVRSDGTMAPFATEKTPDWTRGDRGSLPSACSRATTLSSPALRAATSAPRVAASR